MYHSAFSPAMVSSPFGRAQQFARMYAQVGLETEVEAASPHQLVLMLFDGFLESVGRARLAMQAKLIEVKCQQIGRAVRILDEGLRAAGGRAGGHAGCRAQRLNLPAINGRSAPARNTAAFLPTVITGHFP